MRHLRTHSRDTRISVEIEKPARSGLQELVPEADVVFYSKSWAAVRSTTLIFSCSTSNVVSISRSPGINTTTLTLSIRMITKLTL